MRVAVVAYCCDPTRGTEFALGWGWSEAYVRQGHDVVIVTADDPTSRRGREAALRELAATAPGRVTVVEAGPQLESISSPEGLSGMRELHRLYQQFLHAARDAVADSDCDLAQHVSLGNAQSGFESLLRARGRKVAGPVGGGQIAPWALLPQFGARAVTEIVRSVLWAPMPGRAARVGRTVRPVDLAYGTNPETCATLRRLGAPKVQLMLADGIRPEMLRDAPRPLPVGTPPQLLWMGRLTARKGVWLLLDAAAALRDRLPEFRLFIAGRGPLRDPMAKRIAELGLGTHVTMLGQVPHAELPARLDGTDVHLFTSLRDSSGMQCLEAWARGVPTVHLALHGIGHFAPQAGGVPVSPYPVRTLAERYADAIASTVRDREQLAARSAAALAFAHTETWPAKARRTLADLGLE